MIFCRACDRCLACVHDVLVVFIASPLSSLSLFVLSCLLFCVGCVHVHACTSLCCVWMCSPYGAADAHAHFDAHRRANCRSFCDSNYNAVCGAECTANCKAVCGAECATHRSAVCSANCAAICRSVAGAHHTSANTCPRLRLRHLQQCNVSVRMHPRIRHVAAGLLLGRWR